MEGIEHSLTFSTIASEVIGECHVPYGAALGLIVDKVTAVQQVFHSPFV